MNGTDLKYFKHLPNKKERGKQITEHCFLQSFNLKVDLFMFVRHMRLVARKPGPEVIQLFQAQLNLTSEHEISTAHRNEMLKNKDIS